MRVILTVVDPVRGVSRDVMLEADEEAPVREVGRALAGRLRARTGGVDVFVGGRAVDGRLGLRESPLVDGAVVSLRSAAGCAAVGEPVGLVEARVVGGPGAGVVHRLGPGEFLIGTGPDCAVTLDDPTVAGVAMVLVVGADGSCAVLPAGVGDGFGEVLLDGEPLPAAGRLLPLPLVAEHDETGRGGRVAGDGDGGSTAPGRVADLASGHDDAAPLRPAPMLAVGAVLLTVTVAGPPDLATRPAADGHRLDVNRPPRLSSPRPDVRFRLPPAPARPERRPAPILGALLPAVGAGVMAFALHIYYLLLLALLAPLGMVASHLSGGRRARRAYRRDLAEHRRRLADMEGEIRAALVRECAARRAGAPDPAEVLLTAVGPRRRLWERRRGDLDYLRLRLGTADLPSELTVEDPAEQRPHDGHRPRGWSRTVPDVPVTVALAERGVLGIAGRGELPRVVGCWLLAQAAVLHSPLDLVVYLLTWSDADGASAWDWSRWLPHARPPAEAGGQDAVVRVGLDDVSRARQIGELAQLVAARTASRGGRPVAPSSRGGTSAGLPGHSAPIPGEPDVLVILDGARALRALPGMVSVLRDGPAVGMYSICLDRDVRLLPAECQAVVEQAPGGLRVRQAGGAADVDDVRPDLVATAAALDPSGQTLGGTVSVRGAAAWCERAARGLAALRDVGGGREESTLPTAARLLDVLDLDPPTAAAVAARWAAAPGGGTSFTVGVGLSGPFTLDLRRDGPHGLIAGTTGSGKSELLQSIVASLAVANRPDALTFVLVDYKGGSAFADCVDLPHCVGLVTDLDSHLVARALASLNAELRRREHVLADAGAKDLEDYERLTGLSRPGASGAAGRPPRLPPPPRLVIVIDEFASLARELPEFVAGLVNIAQRGRSLGIHLLLATQRPAGVVSPEIRANTNLRIGLRMTDAGESADVLDAPDAAWIARSTPGRAFARLGHASLVTFQAGRVGGRSTSPGPATGGGRGRAARAPWVVELPWAALGAPAPRRPAEVADDGAVSDLRLLVGAVRAAAELAGVPRQPGPWLPPMPSLVTLGDLLASAARPPAARGTQGGRGRLAPIPIGLSDFPNDQDQRPYLIDLDRYGHLLVVGSARSGRSTVLRTFAGALAATVPSRDAHLFGLDCGNNALLALTALPHTGAVVSADAPERVERLFDRLRAEVAARQEAFASRGYADLGEQRAAEPAAALPYLVLLLDRFEGFLAAFENLDGGRFVDELSRLLREGPAVGLRVVVSADRRGLTGRVASAIENRLVLRLADRGDYPLAGLAGSAVPDGLPPGRGFRLGDADENAAGGAGEDATDEVDEPERDGAVRSPEGAHPNGTAGADEGGGGGGAGGAVGGAAGTFAGRGGRSWRAAPGGGSAVGAAPAVETQVALLAPDPSGQTQVAALARIGAWAAARDGVPPGPATGPRTDQCRPMRIDALPSRITLAETAALTRSLWPTPGRGGPLTTPGSPAPAEAAVTPAGPPGTMAGTTAGAAAASLAPPAPLLGLVGVGGDELGPLIVDLAEDGPGFTVAGPARSGRSTALVTLATTLLAGGTRLVLVTPRPSPLRGLAGARGVLGPLDAAADAGDLARLLRCAGRDDDAPTVVLVDDAELLADTPLAAGLADFLRRARDTRSALVAAGTTEDLLGQFRGFLLDMRRSGCGLLLWPGGPADGEVLGRRLSRSAGGAHPPGRGLYIRRGMPTPVQAQVPVTPGDVQFGGSHPRITDPPRSPKLAPLPAPGIHRGADSRIPFPRDGEGADP
ncbi:FtsK/SpoIIIE domain-containing protein [Pseudofrankia sp. BMG5.37]|uniref:FtsK/SpoIIIE domain-containing protein n=1 Tax=Pseudofrankia sp. BMG5.37 TaxID=3050035 RepID=UPI0028943219|nr:FtsK/SpoIIIE domain-containing protein [Pseudofrankia sp. BMG5.37]MDT3444433.1 FtsK/SpoIIIE domain-containing protein [Pseudofrankia sp. BMG5.37]